MYTNLKAEGLGNFDNNAYWSATEYDNYNAWRQIFNNGNQIYNLRKYTNRVRAVRAF